jgi:hypothetical protein
MALAAVEPALRCDAEGRAEIALDIKIAVEVGLGHADVREKRNAPCGARAAEA